VFKPAFSLPKTKKHPLLKFERVLVLAVGAGYLREKAVPRLRIHVDGREMLSKLPDEQGIHFRVL
jgi:hypothetical protein